MCSVNIILTATKGGKHVVIGIYISQHPGEWKPKSNEDQVALALSTI